MAVPTNNPLLSARAAMEGFCLKSNEFGGAPVDRSIPVEVARGQKIPCALSAPPHPLRVVRFGSKRGGLLLLLLVDASTPSLRPPRRTWWRCIHLEPPDL